MDTSINADTVYSDCYWTTVAEECARQLAACDDMAANFIADKIRAEHVALMAKPDAFRDACRQIIETGAAEFLPLLVRTALDVADQRTSEGLSVSEIVAKALRSFTEPLPVPCEVGP